MKPVQLRKEVLENVIKSGAKLDDVESKAEEYLAKKQLFSLEKKNSGRSSFVRLVELKQRNAKNDKFLIQKLNSRECNGKETFVFKSSDTNLEIIKIIHNFTEYKAEVARGSPPTDNF